jgi:hypothetical protein
VQTCKGLLAADQLAPLGFAQANSRAVIVLLGNRNDAIAQDDTVAASFVFEIDVERAAFALGQSAIVCLELAALAAANTVSKPPMAAIMLALKLALLSGLMS